MPCSGGMVFDTLVQYESPFFPNRRNSMSDKTILYQPFQPREPGFITASELAGAISHQVPSQEPESADCPQGDWYCANPECVVRDVTIFSKLDGAVLPK